MDFLTYVKNGPFSDPDRFFVVVVVVLVYFEAARHNKRDPIHNL